METLVTLLPRSWQSKAKAIAAAIGTILVVLATSLPDIPEWLDIAIAIATTLGVYATPNLDYHHEPRHAKE